MEGDRIEFVEPNIPREGIRAPPPTPEKLKRKREDKKIQNKNVKRDLSKFYDEKSKTC